MSATDMRTRRLDVTMLEGFSAPECICGSYVSEI